MSDTIKGNFYATLPDEVKSLSETMITLWSNFAKTGYVHVLYIIKLVFLYLMLKR